MPKVINNDFHPDDKGLNASQEDHWGTTVKGFGSTMMIGDYEMPQAGKASDYMTEADKKYNKVK